MPLERSALAWIPSGGDSCRGLGALLLDIPDWRAYAVDSDREMATPVGATGLVVHRRGDPAHHHSEVLEGEIVADRAGIDCPSDDPGDDRREDRLLLLDALPLQLVGAHHRQLKAHIALA